MLKASTTPVVLVIEDANRGDFANVLALGQLIADRLDACVEVKRLKLRANVLIPLQRLAMSACPGGRAGGSLRRTLQRVFFSGEYVGDVRPLAVVSTLGRGEAQGAFVSAFWHVPASHLGSPKRLPANCFAIVIAHPGSVPKPTEVALPVAPTRMKLRPRTGGMPQQRIARLCLLLGGDAPGVARYEMHFWSRSIEAAIATAATHGAALTVSTSPRSGAAVEDLVEAALASASLPGGTELYLYGRGDRRDIYPEIRAADVVLVTAESVSMLSDGIASGARTVGLYDTALPTSAWIHSFLERHRAEATLRLQDMAKWTGGPLDLTGITPLTTCWSDTVWPALAPAFAGR